MAIDTAAPGFTIDDPKGDRKNAKRISQYRVSEKALYFPAFPFDQYIPLSAVSRAWIQNATLQLTGCCGKQLPVVLVRVQYPVNGETETRNFTFEQPKQAEEFIALIEAGHPGLDTTMPEKPVRGRVY